MLIIPAIDIKKGNVVRLFQGRTKEKKYSSDPLKIARQWVREGAQFLHIVDLDGAMTGRPVNLKVVKQIAKDIPVPVEFGGGIRKIETIKALLDSGLRRVVLGTKAIEDKKFLESAIKKFKDRIIISIDAESGRVLSRGWKKNCKRGPRAIDFSRYIKSMGLGEIIFTDILKDGTLKGPNIAAIKKMLKQSGMKIIASGGISSLADIRKLKRLEKKGLTGIIIGKALYEGKFSLKEAIKLA